MSTTIPVRQGVYRNGRRWRTEGRHDIVYVLATSDRLMEVRLRSEGPAPYYESDAEVIRIAEVGMSC